MDKYIEIRKAAMYLEDRDAVMRGDRIFCFIKRFADEYDLNGQDIEDYLYEDEQEALEAEEQPEADEALEPDEEQEEEEDIEYLDEVYLSGFCEIKSVSISEVIDFRLMCEDFNPKLILIEGTINGKIVKNQNRLFTARVETNEVFVSQAEMDRVSENFGIPKREDFNQKYLKSIKDIKSEYNFLEHQIFYPDEVDNTDEMNEFYGLTSELNKNNKTSEHGNKKHNANIREQILGCTIAMMVNGGSQKIGRNSQGKIQATDLRVALESHAQYFWQSGYAPLKSSVIDSLYRTWIKYSPDPKNPVPPPFSGGDE